MRILPSLISVLFLTAALSACNPKANSVRDTLPSSSTPSAPTGSPSPTISTVPEATLNIELLTRDELFNQTGGGCGMTLWKQSDGLRPPGYLFYNRLAQKAGDAFTLMKINGQFVRFRRIASTGQEFYGQRTSQTFISQDKSIQLQVDVTLGQPGEIESYTIEGTLQVKHNGQTVKIPVRGSAGC